MRSFGGLALLTALVAGPSLAGPWAVNDGDSQIIIKFEDMSADRGFDPDGVSQLLPDERIDRAISLFAEYGLTDTLTLQLKTDWQQGKDAFVDYEGMGPVELGVRWQAWRNETSAVALYAGYAAPGEGRNAGYEAPGMGDGDIELRALAGHSVEPDGRWMPDKLFVTAEVARRFRSGLADETRGEVTLGVEPSKDWMFLSQVYGGIADDDGPRWLTAEASVVRHFGSWSLQAGWRETVSGRETPESSGLVIGVWKRF